MEVAGQLDEERVSSGRLGPFADQTRFDVELGSGERWGEKALHTPDGCRVQIDLVGTVMTSPVPRASRSRSKSSPTVGQATWRSGGTWAEDGT